MPFFRNPTPKYHVLKDLYYCSVNNNPNILTIESAQISSVNGEHMTSRSYDDVTGFDVKRKTIQIFPKGLQTYFKNLKVIYIENCGLKEIHQAELKPFPNLVYFWLSFNSIEVIEEGLFDYNPNLEAIGLMESKIFHIDPNVFDELTMLKYLWLQLAPCVKKDSWNSEEDLQEVLKLVKDQCTSLAFRIQKDQLDSLEIELKTLNPEKVKAKIEDFERIFKNSRFSKFRPLRNKFEGLKNPKIVNSVDLTSKVNLEPEKCSIESKIDAFYQNLSLTLTDKFRKIIISLSELKSIVQVYFKIYFAPINEKLINIEGNLSKFDDEIANINEKLPNCENKFDKVEEKLGKLEEKFGRFEENFNNFEVKYAERYDKMEKEFTNTKNEISINFDEKIRGIEERLINKFEEILEEKLGKVLEEKLGHLIEAKPDLK